MSVKVEFFEVGRKQASELLECDYAPGSFVIVSAMGHFGCVTSELGWCPPFQDFDAIAEKVEVMYANDLWALLNGISHFAYDYEIWHVVDDGVLWDEWEKKVEQSKQDQSKHDVCNCTLTDFADEIARVTGRRYFHYTYEVGNLGIGWPFSRMDFGSCVNDALIYFLGISTLNPTSRYSFTVLSKKDGCVKAYYESLRYTWLEDIPF